MLDRNEFIASLRELADYLEARPGVPIPSYGIQVPAVLTGEDQGPVLAKAAKAMGTCEKEKSDYFYSLVRRFGAGIEFKVMAQRVAVCERIQVGTRIVEATEEREVPVFEWTCPDALLGLDR